MCGRYVAPDQAAIERAWHVGRHNERNPFQAAYNVAPTTIVPVLRRADDGVLELIEARWGLIPSWWKQPKLPTLTFNARSEEAAAKPMWRGPLRTSRCLMPVSAWYEWQERDWSTGEVLEIKQPWAIMPGGTAAFAGLLSTWTSPQGNGVTSCALLSKAAAPTVAQVHERMPVVLPAPLHDAWLDPAPQDAAAIAGLIAQSRSDFTAHRVSRAVNSARNQGAQLLEPLQP